MRERKARRSRVCIYFNRSINITSLGMVFIMRAQRVIPDIYYFVYLVRAERDIYLSGAWFQFLLQMAIRAHFQF